LADQIKEKKMGRSCGLYGKERGPYRVFMGKHDGNWPSGKPRHRWEENIKRHVKGIGWEGMPQDRHNWLVFANLMMNCWVL